MKMKKFNYGRLLWAQTLSTYSFVLYIYTRPDFAFSMTWKDLFSSESKWDVVIFIMFVLGFYLFIKVQKEAKNLYYYEKEKEED